ncbi:hypothetical protein [Nocardia brasiliensis]|nr:hypothetical protein [Nocardia brasiliensis]
MTATPGRAHALRALPLGVAWCADPVLPSALERVGFGSEDEPPSSVAAV